MSPPQRQPKRDRKQTATQAFYQYAAEHEGIAYNVRIDGQTFPKLEAGAVLPLVLGPPPEEPRPIGYFVTVWGPGGQSYKREFDVDGTLTGETFGAASDE